MEYVPWLPAEPTPLKFEGKSTQRLASGSGETRSNGASDLVRRPLVLSTPSSLHYPPSFQRPPSPLPSTPSSPVPASPRALQLMKQQMELEANLNAARAAFTYAHVAALEAERAVDDCKATADSARKASEAKTAAIGVAISTGEMEIAALTATHEAKIAALSVMRDKSMVSPALLADEARAQARAAAARTKAIEAEEEHKKVITKIADYRKREDLFSALSLEKESEPALKRAAVAMNAAALLLEQEAEAFGVLLEDAKAVAAAAETRLAEEKADCATQLNEATTALERTLDELRAAEAVSAAFLLETEVALANWELAAVDVQAEAQALAEVVKAAESVLADHAQVHSAERAAKAARKRKDDDAVRDAKMRILALKHKREERKRQEDAWLASPGPPLRLHIKPVMTKASPSRSPATIRRFATFGLS